MRKKLILLLKKIGLYNTVRRVRGAKFLLRRITHPLWVHLLLRPIKPLSREFGFDRGTPLDRFYIKSFLDQHRGDITGTCLELLNDDYTRCYGYDITRADVLDIDRDNRRATVHGDLRSLTNVANDTYDCVILTQVLQFIDDAPAAVRELHRILKPGGVALITVPAMSRIDVRAGVDADFWRFTAAGAQYLVGKVFGTENTTIVTCGNHYAGLLFWVGASTADANKNKLRVSDPQFPVIITVRAIKI